MALRILKSHVDIEDKIGWQIATSSGRQNATIINESDLYSLIFSSKLLVEKSLRDGLRNEVLHTISARCFNSWCRDLRPQISIQQRKQNENKIRHKKIREIPVVGGKMPV